MSSAVQLAPPFFEHPEAPAAPEDREIFADRNLPGGARLIVNPRISDSRGHLTFAEMSGALPFVPVRYFLVFGVPSREVRGEHAHKTLHEYLVCAAGRCSVRLFDGLRTAEVLLDRPELGLHIPPMIWTTQYKYSDDAVLLALASDIYRDEDYIRNLDEYMDCRGGPAA